MSKFLELFNKTIKTPRLEMRILLPTKDNASMVYNVLKKENPDNFKYVLFSLKHNTYLPESAEEMLQIMQRDDPVLNKNDMVWYVFYKDKLIGYQKIHYFERAKAFKFIDVWFIESAWNNGFNQEIHKALEAIAFDELGAHSAVRECMELNVRSEKSIRHSGYHLDGCLRDVNHMSDGTWANQLVFTKLETEYKKQR